MAAKPEGFIDPENLWAKPHPRPAKVQPAKEQPRTDMMEDEEEYIDDDIDVDAELEDADQSAEEFDDESADTDEEIIAPEEDLEEIVAETAEEPDDDDDEYEDEDDEDEIDDYDEEEGDDADAELEEVDYDEVDETVVVESETAVSTVEDSAEVDSSDDEVSAVTSIKESRKSPMAEKKKVSISDHVRAEIEKRKASGASLRGVEIVAALGKRGITVSPAQVSQLLKKAGVAPSKKGRPAAVKADTAGEKPRFAGKANKVESGGKIRLKKRAPSAQAPAAPAAVRATPKAQPTAAVAQKPRAAVDRMAAAKAFADACGGFAAAGETLQEAARLAALFGG